ncbi:hypothetical protein [Streptomyces rhizosphaericus]|uniref:hypothetical protein n=1 Tax=Streptomyces rhizosphaericus TaxID=114699 RepID=UPI00117BFAC5|nr:hypothetical protein [Streptomyces rhizosphaericus]
MNTSWAHRTFAEQIPGLTRRHARRTQSLTALLTDAPLRARQVCEAMDMEVTPNNINNTRLKLNRLAERGILVETEQGLFTQPRP